MTFRPHPGINCIDCGAPCCHWAYRCQACQRREAGNFMHVTGKACRGSSQLPRLRRVAEVEESLSYGIEPRRIAADYGIKPDSLARTMHRAGRHDLAAKFTRAAA